MSQIIHRLEEPLGRAVFTLSGAIQKLVATNPAADPTFLAPTTGSFNVKETQVITLRQLGANPSYVHAFNIVSVTDYLHKLQQSDVDAKYLSWSPNMPFYILGTTNDQLEVCWYR